MSLLFSYLAFRKGNILVKLAYLSKITDPIVVSVKKERKITEDLPRQNKKNVPSFRICAYLIYTNNELILFLWMEMSEIFFFFFMTGENLMSCMWNKKSGLHQVISIYCNFWTSVFSLSFSISRTQGEKDLE